MGVRALRSRHNRFYSTRSSGSDIYTGSTKTPDILRDPVKGNSTSVACTPFAEAVGAEHGYWSWLEEKVPLPDGSIGQRPSLEMFGLAMVGGGRVTSTAIFYGNLSSCLQPA